MKFVKQKVPTVLRRVLQCMWLRPKATKTFFVDGLPALLLSFSSRNILSVFCSLFVFVTYSFSPEMLFNFVFIFWVKCDGCRCAIEGLPRLLLHGIDPEPSFYKKANRSDLVRSRLRLQQAIDWTDTFNFAVCFPTTFLLLLFTVWFIISRLILIFLCYF